MFWQLSVDEKASWDDGLSVFPSSQPSTVAVITQQSKLLAQIGR